MSSAELEAPPFDAALPQIRALRIEVRTRWRQPTFISGAILANVLRGALGITLRRLVCPQEWLQHDCPPCPLYAACAYGQVFAPTPPPDAPQLRLQQDLPRPFVVEPPGLHPDDRPTADGLNFRLMLFGRAAETLPYFISTLDRLGCDGLGPHRVPFQIERITALHPRGDEVLFTGGGTSVALPERRITTADLLSAPWEVEHSDPQEASASRRRVLTRLGLADPVVEDRPYSPDRPRIRVHFLTPMLLKTGSGISSEGKRIPATEVRDRPALGVLVRRLRDRLSALCAFFGEPWRGADFAGLGAMADGVTLLESQTTWLTRDRRSTRTGQHQDLSGFIGRATYEFPDLSTHAALAPLLRLGELLHLGKHAPWGHGAVRVTRVEGAAP